MSDRVVYEASEPRYVMQRRDDADGEWEGWMGFSNLSLAKDEANRCARSMPDSFWRVVERSE